MVPAWSTPEKQWPASSGGLSGGPSGEKDKAQGARVQLGHAVEVVARSPVRILAAAAALQRETGEQAGAGGDAAEQAAGLPAGPALPCTAKHGHLLGDEQQGRWCRCQGMHREIRCRDGSEAGRSARRGGCVQGPVVASEQDGAKGKWWGQLENAAGAGIPIVNIFLYRLLE